MSGEVNNNGEVRFSKLTHNQNVDETKNGLTTKTEYQNTIFSFQDDDGIIQESDLTMSVNEDALSEKGKKLLSRIKNYLQKNEGKSWNMIKRGYIKLLSKVFNLKNSFKESETVTNQYGDTRYKYTQDKSNDGKQTIETELKRHSDGTGETSLRTIDEDSGREEYTYEMRDANGTIRETISETTDEIAGTYEKQTTTYDENHTIQKQKTKTKNEPEQKKETVTDTYDKDGNIKKRKIKSTQKFDPPENKA